MLFFKYLMKNCNNLFIDRFPDCPPELSELNWLEKCLVQIVRPVQSMINLRDIGDRKTAIRGTKGAMVLLPVPIESTVEHVATTLPNADNLVLLVDTHVAGKKLVSMPKVIRALQWLKANNWLYRDIIIDPRFKLDSSTKNIIFDRSIKAGK